MLTHLAEHTIDTGECQTYKRSPKKSFYHWLLVGKTKAHQTRFCETIKIHMGMPYSSGAKKDGSVHSCVDYRKVNEVTRKAAFPLPNTNDCLDAVAGATLVSTLEVTSAYNQVPVREADIPKTAFVTRCGLYKIYNNAFWPIQLSRVMELALSGLQWQTCLIDVNDVILCGRNFDEHLERLGEVSLCPISAD